MTTMIREVYEALKEAGATEEKAAAAAEAIEEARDETRLRGIERDVADVKADVRLMKWMLGFLLALAVANLWLLIRG
jgi:hypothetical protein